MFQCKIRGYSCIWFRPYFEPSEQLELDEVCGVFWKWAKLGLVCVLVSQIGFRLYLSVRLCLGHIWGEVRFGLHLKNVRLSSGCVPVIWM